MQKWGKGASEPKQARPDVLGLEDESDDVDEEDDDEESVSIFRIADLGAHCPV